MKRIPVVAGNWKMNLSGTDALKLTEEIRFGLPFPGEIEVIVAPPFLCLAETARHLKKSYIGIAAQNMHFETKGAYTGECSAGQVRDAGADYVIIGHSERRQYFAETDETVNKKIKAAFTHDLIPIVCVGETLEQREGGDFAVAIRNQTAGAFSELSGHEAQRAIIAYEPVWAIGTGKTATPEQVEEVHRLIRDFFCVAYGETVSQTMRILYGGSVKPENSDRLMALPNVDGALAGGASLNAEDFIAIIKSASGAKTGA